MKFEYPPDFEFVVDERLGELIKSIRNRCNIFLAMQDFKDLHQYFPTLLEDLYEDAQKIADDYCVRELGKDA